MLSKTRAAVKEAYEKGYRVIDGKVISPFTNKFYLRCMKWFLLMEYLFFP